MKNFTYLILLLFFSKASYSQCSSGYVLTNVSDTVTLISNGDSSGVFTFPKFNASLGTLIAASIKSETRSLSTYSITNNGAAAALYKSRFINVLELTATEIDPDNPTFTNLAPSLNSVINAGESKVWGPNVNTYSSSFSIPIAHYVNLLGPGTISMAFSNTYSCSVTGPVPYSLSILNIKDTTQVIITYSYCNAISLPLNWIKLKVAEKDNAPELSWNNSTENVNAFIIERAEGNLEFKTIKSVVNTGNSRYVYQDRTSKPAADIYYRIKIQKNDFSENYSEIVHFKSQNTNNIKIVRSYDNLIIQYPTQNNYRVEIINLDGKTVYINPSIRSTNYQVTLPSNLRNTLLIVKVYDSQHHLISVTKH